MEQANIFEKRHNNQHHIEFRMIVDFFLCCAFVYVVKSDCVFIAIRRK